MSSVASNSLPDDLKGQANSVDTEFIDFVGLGLRFASGKLCAKQF
tara:strand:- start:1859 stop:1993 length:135 start_codon:yes stop_codon:yes gene_type:complete